MTRQYFEAKAREKYPVNIERYYVEDAYIGEYDTNVDIRAAYVEAWMEAIGEIEKAWDAATKREKHEQRMNWIPQTEEEYNEARGEHQRELSQYAPPTKSEYINKLFK